MRPIKPHGYDAVFGQGQDEYIPLPVYRHDDSWKCVSACWYLNWRERIKVLFTGRIYTTLPTFGKPLTPQKVAVDNPKEKP